MVPLLDLVLAVTLAAAPAAGCPVTAPTEPSFVPPAPHSPAPLGPEMFIVGTNDLWVALPRTGRVSQRDKIFWWTPAFPGGAVEPRPNFTVTLEPHAGTIATIADRPATNAGVDGWAILTMIDFPSPGCWDVTGTYQGRSLTFVVAVEASHPAGAAR